MHPTRLRCCCSTCSRFCALYFTCAAAAAHHQRGPLRHLRAALGTAADAAAPLLHRRAHLGDASRHDTAGFMDATPRGWQPCHLLWPDHSDPAAVVLYCVRCARARGTSIQLRPRMETRLSFACTCTALSCTGRAHDLIAITTPSSATHQLTTSTAQLLSLARSRRACSRGTGRASSSLSSQTSNHPRRRPTS